MINFNPAKPPKWGKCPACKEEWSGLRDGELCPDCVKAAASRIPEPDLEGFNVNDRNVEAVNRCRNFILERKGIYLHGEAGHGKSHLCRAFYNTCKNHSKWLKMSELNLRLQETAHRRADGTAWELINSYLDCTYLFMDEFNGDAITAKTTEAVFYMLDTATDRKGPKIFMTSNMDIKQVNEIMGDRVASRICGLCEILKLDDYDHRVGGQQ